MDFLCSYQIARLSGLRGICGENMYPALLKELQIIDVDPENDFSIFDSHRDITIIHSSKI
ncbi:hypothetical protein HI914_02250 [Erysiphe necator]|nr:hypothetical protein HI914_02250 [Erysiphe necator]